MNALSPSSRAARRATAREVRDAFPAMGVYAILDRESGRVLLRASRNVPAALNRARFELRMRSHADRTLQAAWDEGGAERIAFEVIELVKERDDPAFDYAGELKVLEELHREALAAPAGAGHAGGAGHA